MKLLESTRWSYTISILLGAFVLSIQLLVIYLGGSEKQAPAAYLIMILLPIAVKLSKDKSLKSVHDNLPWSLIIVVLAFSVLTGPYQTLELYISSCVMKFTFFSVFVSSSRSIAKKLGNNNNTDGK